MQTEKAKDTQAVIMADINKEEGDNQTKNKGNKNEGKNKKEGNKNEGKNKNDISEKFKKIAE